MSSYLLDTALELFQESCNKVYLDQLGRRDMLEFIGFLRNKGYRDRTIHNVFASVITFLRTNGVKDLVAYSDYPRYTPDPVDAYADEEMKALFAAADENEWLIFQFFLGSGFREQEVS